jgi:hypothetical protein
MYWRKSHNFLVAPVVLNATVTGIETEKQMIRFLRGPHGARHATGRVLSLCYVNVFQIVTAVVVSSADAAFDVGCSALHHESRPEYCGDIVLECDLNISIPDHQWPIARA